MKREKRRPLAAKMPGRALIFQWILAKVNMTHQLLQQLLSLSTFSLGSATAWQTKQYVWEWQNCLVYEWIKVWIEKKKKWINVVPEKIKESRSLLDFSCQIDHLLMWESPKGPTNPTLLLTSSWARRQGNRKSSEDSSPKGVKNQLLTVRVTTFSSPKTAFLFNH